MNFLIMLYGDRIMVGLVGIPSSGKTTIFNLLCKASAEVAPYPFTTKSKNQGIMLMYEPRADKLAQILKSSEVKYPAIEIWDVAGLIKGAHKGEGLGNEFLSYIRPLDLVVYVLRDLESVPHVEGSDDIVRDFDILRYEIAMSDLEIISRKEEKLKKLSSVGQKEAKELLELYSKIKEGIEKFAETGRFSLNINEKEKFKKLEEEIKNLSLISAKPYIVLINTDKGKDKWEDFKVALRKYMDGENSGGSFKVIVSDVLSEMDMSESEVREFGITPLRELLSNAVKETLKVVIFFTGFEGKELRSWIVKEGVPVIEAAGMIHSDMKKGFISAEVAEFEEYSKCSSDEEAYKKGIFKTVSKDHIVKDGEIIRIKFKV